MGGGVVGTMGVPPSAGGTDLEGSRWKKEERTLSSEHQRSYGGNDETWLERWAEGIRSAGQGVSHAFDPLPYSPKQPPPEEDR